MNEYDNISRLIDRFLEGETTLSEERTLETFFVTHADQTSEMPEQLQIVAEMFREIRAMRQCARPTRKRPKIVWWTVAAACIAACLLTFWPRQNVQTDEHPKVLVLTVTRQDTAAITQQSDTISPIATLAPTQLAMKKPKKKAVTTHSQIEATNETSGSAMLCTLNPQDNMIPMQNDAPIRAVMMECELTILEEEYQSSKHVTIEI